MSLLSESLVRVPREASTWRRHLSYRTIGFFIAGLDFATILLASVIAGLSYHAAVLGMVGDLGAFIGIGANAGLLFVLLNGSQKAYRTPLLLSVRKRLEGVVVAWLFVMLTTTALLFLLKIAESYSRGSIVVFAGLGLGLLLWSRVIIAATLRQALARGELRGPRAIVIGDRDELENAPAADLNERYGTWEVNRFELPPGAGEESSSLAAVSAVLNAAIEAARAVDVKQILLALRWNDAARREYVCDRLRVLPLPVFLVPDRSVSSVLAQPTQEMGTQIAVEVQRAPMSPLELALKRALDIVLAATGLMLLSPLLAIVSLLIKLDSPGPVLFRQRRMGFNGREFTIYKFRTMTVLEDGEIISQCRKNDPRITGIGRILRATSIDELPQLLNVLHGEMSLVGPRPHALAHDGQYANLIAEYAFRHNVKPGITGWAQVNGLRGETAELVRMRKRVDFDLWYIDHWSVWLDLWIISRTCVEIARGRNAY